MLINRAKSRLITITMKSDYSSLIHSYLVIYRIETSIGLTAHLYTVFIYCSSDTQ